MIELEELPDLTAKLVTYLNQFPKDFLRNKKHIKVAVVHWCRTSCLWPADYFYAGRPMFDLESQNDFKTMIEWANKFYGQNNI